MKNDEILITKLIEETCKDDEHVEKETPTIIDLSDYFEKKVNQVEYLSLKKYMTQQSLDSFKMFYNDNNQCFNLTLKEMSLDFPSNWSIFSKLKATGVTYVNKEEDNDLLCDIFSEINAHCESFLLINENGEFNLVTFSDYSGRIHYEWVKGYFEKKTDDQESEAA